MVQACQALTAARLSVLPGSGHRVEWADAGTHPVERPAGGTEGAAGGDGNHRHRGNGCLPLEGKLPLLHQRERIS